MLIFIKNSPKPRARFVNMSIMPPEITPISPKAGFAIEVSGNITAPITKITNKKLKPVLPFLNTSKHKNRFRIRKNFRFNKLFMLVVWRQRYYTIFYARRGGGGDNGEQDAGCTQHDTFLKSKKSSLLLREFFFLKFHSNPAARKIAFNVPIGKFFEWYGTTALFSGNGW